MIRDWGTLVVAAHRVSRWTYGSPRLLDELREAGERTSRKRIARLMKERGIVGEMRKRWRHPASSPTAAACPPNTLNRGFAVALRTGVWARDITYIRTWEGWLYLAVVIDLFSRRVVGWLIHCTPWPAHLSRPCLSNACTVRQIARSVSLPPDSMSPRRARRRSRSRRPSVAVQSACPVFGLQAYTN
jgi:transposase InsO family protein